MEEQGIDRFRTYLASHLGLQFEDRALTDLEDVLERRLQELGYDDIEPYLQYLDSSKNHQAEVRVLAEQLTVGETYFYRNLEQINAFSEVVLPDLLQARATERRLRILSAGCASGEEPYTLAMVIRDQWPLLVGWDIRVEAIDINHSALQKAKQGRYSARSVRHAPKQVQERYFSTAGSLHAVIPSLKETVQFEERNLLDEDANFWQANSRDVIFCRNVIIYFSPLATQEVIARFERSLAPGGYLFLGHSETLRGISQAFELCNTNDTFYYKRRSADQAGMSARSYPSLPLERAVGRGWDDSWSEVIGKASARIAQLTNDHIAGEPAAAATLRQPGLQERTAVAAAPLAQAQLALDLFRQERFADALKELERLPGALETDCDAQLLHAATLTNQGLLAEAEAICTQVLHLDSLNTGAHYLRALCHEHAGDRRAARQDAQAAVYLDRSFAMPHLQLGLMAKRSGDLETSRRELGSALGLLAREDPARILLFGGGFNREALTELCRSELRGLEKTIGTATRA